MTSTGPRLDRRSLAELHAERRRLWAQPQAEQEPWHAGSTVVAHVLALGGAGWLLAHWTGWSWAVPVGIVLGMVAALTTIWFRYGVERPPAGGPQVTDSAAGARVRSGAPQDPRTTDRCPLEDAP